MSLNKQGLMRKLKASGSFLTTSQGSLLKADKWNCVLCLSG